MEIIPLKSARYVHRSNYFLASLITSKSNDINSPKKRVWHLINYSYQLSPLTRGVGSRSTFITSCSICAACTEQKKGGFVRKNERKKNKKQERDTIFLNFTQLTPICKFNIWSLGKFSNYQLFPKLFHELQSLFLFRSCTVLTICYRRGQESVLCAHCRSKSGKPGFTETAWRGRESGDPPSSILRQALSGHHTTPCSLSAYAKVQLLNRCWLRDMENFLE